jgi:argininosuccinate lyase
MSKKAWSGRFDEKESPLMERFNASLGFDWRLYEQDIRGSLAHASMLKKIGILSATEHGKIEAGLKKILSEIAAGKFIFDAAHEDIHMAVEMRLTDLIGPLGGKLHTARSRNDQVALDTRLFVREHTQNTIARLKKLQNVFLDLATKHTDTILPGYTHLQRAQPILLAHHLLAYGHMLERDKSRFHDNLKRLDACPLGAGALAGSPIAIDRYHVAKALGFSKPTSNSLDTVADRDFVLDFLSAASLLMMHLSRLAEELVLWSSQEFGFITLPQQFCTGSSMMPQKINPDAAELIRGKTGRVYGNLVNLLTTLKALPLAYNKDMQEDKEALFDTLDTITLCLDVLAQMLPGTQFHKNKMLKATRDGFLLATDVADYLSKKGLPFRQAHEIVGKIVRHCLEKNLVLEDLSEKVLHSFCPLFRSNIKEILNIKSSLDARESYGGTAKKSVLWQIKEAKKSWQK